MAIGSSHSLLETLRCLAAEGLSLDQMLPCVTSNVARLMRLPGKGVIAEGMDADLLVLDDQMQVQHLLAGDRWHIKNGRQEIQGSYESVPTSNKPATGA